MTGPSTRVLIQVNSLELGGSQINAVDLAAAVRPHGIEAVLVGPADSRREGPSLMDVAEARGVSLHAMERPQSTAGGARELTRLATLHGADLVHVYGTWATRFAYLGPCRMARRPLVVTVYEMEVDDVVPRGCELIVGTRYLVDELGGRRGPVHLISPPTDLERDAPGRVDGTGFLRDHDLEPDHLRVVVVSRLDGMPLRPVKTTAILAAFEAVARSGRPDVDVVVVGTGKDEAEVRAAAGAANAVLGRPACRLLGPMADPRPAYEVADVMLGMGGSAARALAFGKPLVASGEFGEFATFDERSAPSIFRTSFWSEQERPDPAGELWTRLAPLLDDRDTRVRLGRFGRSFAEEHFALTAMAERLADIYRRAAGRYTRVAWAHDLPLELRWLAGTLGRRVAPGTRLAGAARAWTEAAGRRATGVDGYTSGAHDRRWRTG